MTEKPLLTANPVKPAFSAGDVVCLRSGGPKMTVCTDIDTAGSVEVRWINNELKMETLTLQVKALRHVHADEQ